MMPGSVGRVLPAVARGGEGGLICEIVAGTSAGVIVPVVHRRIA